MNIEYVHADGSNCYHDPEERKRRGCAGVAKPIFYANLGYATTTELLDELKARAEVGGYANYRTVDE